MQKIVSLGLLAIMLVFIFSGCDLFGESEIPNEFHGIWIQNSSIMEINSSTIRVGSMTFNIDEVDKKSDGYTWIKFKDRSAINCKIEN